MNWKKFLLAIAVMAAMTEMISSQPEQMQPELLLSEQESDSVSPLSQDNTDELEELPNHQRTRRQAVAQPVDGSWPPSSATNNQRCYYYYFYVGNIRYWYYSCYNARNQQTYYYAPTGTPQQPPPPAPPQPPMPPTHANKFRNFFRSKFGA